MYSLERSEKSTGDGSPGAGAALADLHLGACDELEDAIHVAVRHQLAARASRSRKCERAGEAVRALGVTGREELAA